MLRILEFPSLVSSPDLTRGFLYGILEFLKLEFLNQEFKNSRIPNLEFLN